MHGLQFIEYTYYNRFGLKYIEKIKKNQALMWKKNMKFYIKLIQKSYWMPVGNNGQI